MGKEERDWSRLLKYPLASWFLSVVVTRSAFEDANSAYEYVMAGLIVPAIFVTIAALLALLKIAFADNNTSIRLPWQAQKSWVAALSCTLFIGTLLSLPFGRAALTFALAIVPLKIMLWPPAQQPV